MSIRTILFQGDSITDGNRYKDESSRWDLNHQIGHAYPYVIAALLGSEHPEKNYKFLNRGVSGDNISQIYGRWQQDAILLKPDLISILVGVNETCMRNGEYMGSTPERYEKIYNLLLEEALEAKPDTKFVLIEPFLLNLGTAAKNYDQDIKLIHGLQKAVYRVSRRFQTAFVPMQSRIDALCRVQQPSYWLWDGIHPTEAGHGVLAQAWLEETKELLR